MSRLIPPLALAVVAVLLAAAPASARRAKPTVVPNPLSRVAIRGTTTQGRFHGRFGVDSFTVAGGRLVASGALLGTLEDRRFPGPQPILVQDWELAAAPLSVGADCAQLDIAFAARNTRFLSLSTTIPARVVHIRTDPRRSSRLLREVVCTVNSELASAGGSATDTLLHALDALAHVPPERRA